MTAPTWTILVPTISPREALFRRLLARLLPQLDEPGGRVQLMAWRNDGQPTIGEIRDAMIAEAYAKGSDYVSFVDDDDLVTPDYVRRIWLALASRPDHVGFRVNFVNGDSGEHEIVDHSLRHGRWHRSGGMLLRDFTHIDPIRTEYAICGHFSRARAGRAEDRVWVRQVRPFLATEEYIPDVLYHYLWSSETSAWQRPEQIVPSAKPRPVVDHPHFSWHPSSDA